MNSNPRKGWIIMDNEKDMEIKEETAVAEIKPETSNSETPIVKPIIPAEAAKPKEKKKKGKAGLVVALAIGCTLTGAAIGIGGTLAFMGLRGPGRMRMGNFRQEDRFAQFERSDSNPGSGYGRERSDGNKGNRQRSDDNQDRNSSKDNRIDSGNRGQGRPGNGNRGQGKPDRNGKSNNGTNNENQPQGNQTPDNQAPNDQTPNGQTPDANGQAPSGQTGGTNA